MRFGIVLPTYPAGATVEGVVKVAQAAEKLGFCSAWTTDHVILPVEQAGPYREIFEPLMTVAYLAAVTSTVTLGISVIVVPQRNGIVLAKEIATLDHLCKGRLIVGVGAGWNQDEFNMLETGHRFHHRGAHLNETLRLWEHLWTTPEQPFSGTYYDLPEVAFGPLPYTEGGPQIWVGGPSEGARRRAGKFGTAWHPVGISAADLAEKSELVLRAAEEAGRPAPELAPRLPMHIGSGATGQMTAGRATVLQAEPDEMIERLKEYEQAGASEIVCLFGSPDGDAVIEQMQILSEQVMPSFA